MNSSRVSAQSWKSHVRRQCPPRPQPDYCTGVSAVISPDFAFSSGLIRCLNSHWMTRLTLVSCTFDFCVKKFSACLEYAKKTLKTLICRVDLKLGLSGHLQYSDDLIYSTITWMPSGWVSDCPQVDHRNTQTEIHWTSGGKLDASKNFFFNKPVLKLIL